VHTLNDNRILHKECRSLLEAGFDVTLLGCAPEPQLTPDLAGVRIVTVPKPRRRIQRFLVTVPRLGLMAARSKADVCHLHDPELLMIAPILKLSGKRVIYDVHENVPEQIRQKTWIPSLLRGVAARAAQISERASRFVVDCYVVANPSTMHRFPETHSVLVQNLIRLEEFEGTDSTLPYCQRSNKVSYVGVISPLRAAREMVQAIGRVDVDPPVELILGGPIFPPSLKADLEELSGAERTSFVGWVHRTQVGELLRSSRLGLSLAFAKQHEANQSTKLFEYMASGIPFVASDFPVWRTLFGDGNYGLLVNPRSVEEIATAIERLLRHPQEAEEMGRRGRAEVEVRFNWQLEVPKLVGAYEMALEKASLSPE